MLVVMESGATPDQIQRVVQEIEALGCVAEPIPGPSRTAICVLQNKGAIDPRRFQVLPGVKEAIAVSKPYKLVSRETHPEDSVVRVGSGPDAALIGGPDAGLAMIAGPCAVESLEQCLAIARAVKAAGATIFRGGAFKPRTSPYAFQGLGREGLEILAEVREETGLPVVTEAIDHEVVDVIEEHADMIQIGARNMQNFTLLKRAGRSKLPVLLKRGMAATVDEWLMAAEYVMSEGNRNVILCERGVRTFADHARNTLDLSAVCVVKKRSHLPVIVDPSHAAGQRDYVAALAFGAVAAGADGLIIEVHNDPDRAMSDGPQSMYPNDYADLAPRLREMATLAGKLRLAARA
jgi:3-deoxy-7-phosphoheptulonate synthase